MHVLTNITAALKRAHLVAIKVHLHCERFTIRVTMLKDVSYFLKTVVVWSVVFKKLSNLTRERARKPQS